MDTREADVIAEIVEQLNTLKCCDWPDCKTNKRVIAIQDQLKRVANIVY